MALRPMGHLIRWKHWACLLRKWICVCCRPLMDPNRKETVLAWLCCIWNLWLAGRRRRTFWRSWIASEVWTAAGWDGSNCTGIGPPSRCPTAGRRGWSGRWTASHWASGASASGRGIRRPARRGDEDHFQRSGPPAGAGKRSRGAAGRRVGPPVFRRRGGADRKHAGRSGRWPTKIPGWAAATWSNWSNAAAARCPGRGLDVGSPVVLSPEVARNAPPGWRGVVYQRDEQSLRVALPGVPDDLATTRLCALDLSSDEVAVQRQQLALRRARSAAGERLAAAARRAAGRSRTAVRPRGEPTTAGRNA